MTEAEIEALLQKHMATPEGQRRVAASMQGPLRLRTDFRALMTRILVYDPELEGAQETLTIDIKGKSHRALDKGLIGAATEIANFMDDHLCRGATVRTHPAPLSRQALDPLLDECLGQGRGSMFMDIHRFMALGFHEFGCERELLSNGLLSVYKDKNLFVRSTNVVGSGIYLAGPPPDVGSYNSDIKVELIDNGWFRITASLTLDMLDNPRLYRLNFAD